jgi:hypothetical protein
MASNLAAMHDTPHDKLLKKEIFEEEEEEKYTLHWR